MSQAAKPEILRKAVEVAETNFTPGEMSDVAWITTDTVDHDGHVVISAGVDFKSVFYDKNPVVLAYHEFGNPPIGRCDWIKLAKPSATNRFSGLTAKTLWYADDPDAVKLFGMVQSGLIRGRSVTIRPCVDHKPGDWGPPTSAEIKARPDWANAGMIIRRCVLIEYSVVTIPMNSEALTIAVSKGLQLPSFVHLAKASPAEPAEVEVEAEAQPVVDAVKDAQADAFDLPPLPIPTSAAAAADSPEPRPGRGRPASQARQELRRRRDGPGRSDPGDRPRPRPDLI